MLELWYWRRLLRVAWTARRSNQSILKEISAEYSLEGLLLKLKLQYFGHLMRRTDIWKDPAAGKYWRQEEKGTTEDEMVGWHHQLDGHEFEWTLAVGDGRGGLVCCSPRGCKESDTTEWRNRKLDETSSMLGGKWCFKKKWELPDMVSEHYIECLRPTTFIWLKNFALGREENEEDAILWRVTGQVGVGTLTQVSSHEQSCLWASYPQLNSSHSNQEL